MLRNGLVWFRSTTNPHRALAARAIDGCEAALVMSPITEGAICRLPTATECHCRFVRIHGKTIPVGIDDDDRAFNQQRAIVSYAYRYIGHVLHLKGMESQQSLYRRLSRYSLIDTIFPPAFEPQFGSLRNTGLSRRNRLGWHRQSLLLFQLLHAAGD